MEKLTGSKETRTSQVLANGLRLLSTIAKANGEFSVREIGRMLDLSPTVTHRLVATLQEHHYLEKNLETGKYVIGLESFRVGKSYSDAFSLEGVAKPVLYAAAHENSVNCFLGRRKGTSIVYLHDFSGAKRSSIRIASGTEVPLDATSMGIAILAQLDPKSLEDYQSRAIAEGLRDQKDFDSKFEQSLEFARTHGYAMVRSEIFPGVNAVGATVGFPGRLHDSAISFSAQTSSPDLGSIELLGAKVIETSAILSQQLQAAKRISSA